MSLTMAGNTADCHSLFPWCTNEIFLDVFESVLPYVMLEILKFLEKRRFFLLSLLLVPKTLILTTLLLFFLGCGVVPTAASPPLPNLLYCQLLSQLQRLHLCPTYCTASCCPNCSVSASAPPTVLPAAVPTAASPPLPNLLYSPPTVLPAAVPSAASPPLPHMLYCQLLSQLQHHRLCPTYCTASCCPICSITASAPPTVLPAADPSDFAVLLLPSS
jgi:hypothetical protein